MNETEAPIYHNTTNLEGDQHVEAVTKAAKQDMMVYQAFTEMQKFELTPFQIWEYLINNNRIKQLTPVTSIRRSMHTLTQKYGLLEKTGHLVMERLGKPNFTWRLKIQGQMKLFGV